MNATETAPALRSSPSLGDTMRKLLKPIASLQLTVALFAMSLVLVFFGTLAQKNAGIWQVVDQYFWSWIVMIDTQLFVQFLQIFLGLSPDTSLSIPIPFPGGKLIGGVMFVNLLAAHIVRFKLTWKRAGVYILHSGLLLMFAGEFIAREFTVEQQMVIPEGQSVNFTIDTRNYELAIIDPSDPLKDRVTVIPVSKLQQGGTIALPEWSFDLKALDYYANAEVFDVADPKAKDVKEPARATQGFGLTSVAKAAPPVSGVDTDKKNDNPTAYVELVRKGSGQSVAIVLAPWAWKPQKIDVDGKTYLIQMRNTHYYKPYSVHLNQFRFDRYIGTNTPKNYSSDIRLTDSEQSVEFEKRIAMNEPMRYRGETFYQSSFSPDETHTILSVVKNPGALLPYISCIVVGLGMLVHFGIHLLEYVIRLLGKRQHVESTKIERWMPWGVLAFMTIAILGAAMPKSVYGRKDLDLTRAARLPVVEGGRVKPLDTVARVSMRKLNHKESYTSPEDNLNRPAFDWWLATASAGENPSESVSFKSDVFRIENDQVLNLLGLNRREGLRYSAGEIRRKFSELQLAVAKAEAKPDKQRDLFDAKVLELFSKLRTHANILSGEGSLAIAPVKGGEWRSISSARDVADNLAIREYGTKVGQPMGTRQELAGYLRALPREQQEKAFEDVMEMIYRKRAEDADLKAWDDLFAAYRAGNQEKLNAAVDVLERTASERVSSGDLARVRFESLLNDTSLYYWCIYLYVTAFLLTVGSWAILGHNAGLAQAWRRSSFLVLVLAFALHTFTLLSRMYLMDRPMVFVTNLYSTAVFIGWAAVGVSLLVELFMPITLGNTVAATIGFLTSILAHNLAASGDTLEMMQAVLDTNFWLATHVTTINLGYSATYIAGVIGIIYLVVGIFTPHISRKYEINGRKMELGRLIGQILYGAIAAATMLSFIGTVLGGIWGDQSWGRFWGWDPKENGALMIVLWNAMILHARWCGLVKDRGIAVLALGGNMITTWSYFGTNQLGVGLHAYGFSNTLAAVCVWMWLINLGLIGMGLLPKQFWRSYQPVEK